MTKNKQKDNPKFGFLFGGEHFNYYQYKVTTEQASKWRTYPVKLQSFAREATKRRGTLSSRRRDEPFEKRDTMFG